MIREKSAQMGKPRLCKFSKEMVQLALGHTGDEEELSLLDMYRRSNAILKKVECLKRLYTMEQIKELFQELWVESDAEEYYCYVCADEVLASCHTFRYENIRAYSLLRWDFEDQTQVWDREERAWISRKKIDDPFRLVQIEGVLVSESHRNQGIGTKFLRKVLDHLSSRSNHLFVYINVEGDNLPAQRCYQKVMEYSGENHPLNYENRYWIVK